MLFLLLGVELLEEVLVCEHGRKDGDEERGAYALLTLDLHCATHLFNNALANAQSKARALIVHARVRLELLEVNEKLADIFLCYTSAFILYLNLESH